MSELIFVLDDQPERFNGLLRFSDATFFLDVPALIAELESMQYLDELWLDHDLGEDTPTGMALVDALCERASNDIPLDVGKIFVHTMNASVARTMCQQLERWGYNVWRFPISQLQDLSPP